MKRLVATPPPGATTSRDGTAPGREDRRRWWRPLVNITPVERVGRVLLGALGIVAGAILLAGAGALGHCPLYRKLGYVARSLRRPA